MAGSRRTSESGNSQPHTCRSAVLRTLLRMRRREAAASGFALAREDQRAAKKYSPRTIDSTTIFCFYSHVLLDEGRLRRRSQRRSGMRRPRARLVTSHPGGRGHPSAPTTRGCLRWLDAVGLKAGGSPPDKRRQRRRPPPGSTGPRTKTAAVERREAPSPDRKGEGDASQASRAAAPAAQGVSQTPAFPGAPLPSSGSHGRGPCPGRHNNRGDLARLRYPVIPGRERSKRIRNPYAAAEA